MDTTMYAYDDGATTKAAICLPPKVAYLTDEARRRVAEFARRAGRPLAGLVLRGEDPSIDRGNPPIILHSLVSIAGEDREVYILALEDGGVLLCAVAPSCLMPRVATSSDRRVVDESADHTACGDARAAKIPFIQGAKSSPGPATADDAWTAKALETLEKLSRAHDDSPGPATADDAWTPAGLMGGMPMPVYEMHCGNVAAILCRPDTTFAMAMHVLETYLRVTGCGV